MSEISTIRKEFYKLQKQLMKQAESNDSKFEQLGILLEKLEKEADEKVRRVD